MSAERGAEALAHTEREILGEKAAALGRAGERLEDALAEVARVSAALAQTAAPAERDRLEAEYDEAWRRAARARQMLVIQREAVGLRHHRIVDQQFPVPPRRRDLGPPGGTPASR